MPANCNESLYVTARHTPIDFILVHVTTGENDDLVNRHHLVHEEVWKPMEKCPPHVAILGHRLVHLRVEFEEGERGFELGDERTAEAR